VHRRRLGVFGASQERIVGGRIEDTTCWQSRQVVSLSRAAHARRLQTREESPMTASVCRGVAWYRTSFFTVGAGRTRVALYRAACDLAKQSCCKGSQSPQAHHAASSALTRPATVYWPHAPAPLWRVCTRWSPGRTRGSKSAQRQGVPVTTPLRRSSAYGRAIRVSVLYILI